MGELHIEIIQDRIRREHKLETYLGPLQIAYRETIQNSAKAIGKVTVILDLQVNDLKFCWQEVQCDLWDFYYFVTDTLDRTVGEKRHQVTVELGVRPWEGETSATAPVIEYAENVCDSLQPDLREAIANGIHTSFLQGKSHLNPYFEFIRIVVL